MCRMALLAFALLCFVFRFLDMSFNYISQMEHLESLTSLKKLFLIQNKIASITNLQPLVNLTMLELGSNKIRVNG